MSGRLPIHHGEELSDVTSDDIDLRWTLIGTKLKRAGYRTHWVGKGHTGYRSVAHLPIHNGFDTHVGLLGGAGVTYYGVDRWNCTARQRGLLIEILERNGLAHEVVENLSQELHGRSMSDLSKMQVSSVIGEVLDRWGRHPKTNGRKDR